MSDGDLVLVCVKCNHSLDVFLIEIGVMIYE